MYITKLKEYLTENQISIKELCKEIDMSEGGFHQAVKVNSFKVQTIEKISEFLGVPVAFWFTNDKKPEVQGDNLLLLREVKYLTEKIVDQNEKLELMRRIIREQEEQIKQLKKD